MQENALWSSLALITPFIWALLGQLHQDTITFHQMN